MKYKDTPIKAPKRPNCAIVEPSIENARSINISRVDIIKPFITI